MSVKNIHSTEKCLLQLLELVLEYTPGRIQHHAASAGIAGKNLKNYGGTLDLLNTKKPV